MTIYDAAVVGGGLAGCSAAIKLAERGWRVVLFEARAYPHHKVCGEFLSPECAAILGELGVMETIDDLHPPKIHHAVMTIPDGFKWTTQLPGVAVGLSRYALDTLLAQRAGAVGVEICENSPVTGIEGHLDDGFILKANKAIVRAKMVIAAHGKRSNFDRVLDRAFLKKHQPFVALKAHFEGVSIEDRVELHSFPGGYCGLSDIEGQKVNLCLLTRVERFRQHHDIAGFIGWMQHQNPYLREWFSGAKQITQWLSIAQMPFIDKKVVERDVLMVGDAAGLIAPLAGDGMSMALYGGKKVASFVSDYLSGQLSSARLRQAYTASWRDRFVSRLRLGRLLQEVMLRPRLLSLGLRVVNNIPRLGDYFVTQTRERLS